MIKTILLLIFEFMKTGLMAVGGGCLLAELFQHLTFRTPMFAWSPYAAAVFCLFGGFLILAGIIRPLREHLARKFFI